GAHHRTTDQRRVDRAAEPHFAAQARPQGGREPLLLALVEGRRGDDLDLGDVAVLRLEFLEAGGDLRQEIEPPVLGEQAQQRLAAVVTVGTADAGDERLELLRGDTRAALELLDLIALDDTARGLEPAGPAVQRALLARDGKRRLGVRSRDRGSLGHVVTPDPSWVPRPSGLGA